MNTPTTPDGVRQFDELDPLQAALMAWVVAGEQPGWHRQAQDAVRRAMPLLGRALDRAAAQLAAPRD